MHEAPIPSAPPNARIRQPALRPPQCFVSRSPRVTRVSIAISPPTDDPADEAGGQDEHEMEYVELTQGPQVGIVAIGRRSIDGRLQPERGSRLMTESEDRLPASVEDEDEGRPAEDCESEPEGPLPPRRSPARNVARTRTDAAGGGRRRPTLPRPTAGRAFDGDQRDDAHEASNRDPERHHVVAPSWPANDQVQRPAAAAPLQPLVRP